jgi:TRAP-type uncharacterized transport system substrate-binding protein
VFEHHQTLVNTHPSAKETLPANVGRDKFLPPLRPGALRYHHKMGVKVPDLATPDTATNDRAGDLT